MKSQIVSDCSFSPASNCQEDFAKEQYFDKYFFKRLRSYVPRKRLRWSFGAIYELSG